MPKVNDETSQEVRKLQTSLENTFKTNTRNALEARSLSTATFAIENGFDHSYLNKILRLDRKLGLRLSTMVKISYSLEIPLSDLLKSE